ncbi:MAG: hypothetical protein JWP59_1396 [Massilia sp.]|jgi:hypothetical protein|nr:hypothetical protein [Massilia sp.]
MEPRTVQFYQPEHSVSGPAYGGPFKIVSTLIVMILLAYGFTIALRFPLLTYGFGVKLVLVGATSLLIASWYWFLKGRTTIDADGVRQSAMIDKRVRWDEVRSAKMLGIPYLGWLFPPRLVVRTGNSFVTFNGGSQALLIEFARISIAYQMKK